MEVMALLLQILGGLVVLVVVSAGVATLVIWGGAGFPTKPGDLP
jgi:hypothetical protein